MPLDNFKTLFIAGNLDAPFPSMDFFLKKTYNFLPKPILIQSVTNSFITLNKSKYTHVQLLDKEELVDLLRKSELIITHAGVGLTNDCIKNNKKFLLIPRMPLWREHCDFHQFEWFELIENLYPEIIKINFTKLDNPKYCETIVQDTMSSINSFNPKILKNYFNSFLLRNAVKSILKRYS